MWHVLIHCEKQQFKILVVFLPIFAADTKQFLFIVSYLLQSNSLSIYSKPYILILQIVCSNVSKKNLNKFAKSLISYN